MVLFNGLLNKAFAPYRVKINVHSSHYLMLIILNRAPFLQTGWELGYPGNY